MAKAKLILALAASSGWGVITALAKELPPVFASEVNKCEAVSRLQKCYEAESEGPSSLLRSIFSMLFPFDSPGKNAVLATFYISSIPNILLAFIPAQIDPSTMSIMTAFAAGGLLSDVFVHLIPHSFMGEEEHEGVQFMLVEEKRNVIIGLSIFLGFAFFFAAEKVSRVLSGGDDAQHHHPHGHSHVHVGGEKSSDDIAAHSSAVSTSRSNEMRQRAKVSGESDSAPTSASPIVEGAAPSKLSAYLNLMGDFTHNVTDGLVIAASFYSSPIIGATSTLACFAHEIPHEIADFSILVRSGFTKRQAMASQFLTAIGAFCGTFLGIAIHHAASDDSAAHEDTDLTAAVLGRASGILGTTLKPAELVVPAIAGGFIYISTVAVVPLLLQENRGMKQAMKEFGAMAFGVACMVLVAWNE